MKTKQQNKQEKKNSKAPELLSRSEQLSGNNNIQTEQTPETQNSEITTAPAPAPADNQTINNQPSTINPAKRILPYVNYAEREKGRSLPSAEVLAHLRRWYPRAYELAEVIGAWVWVTFPEQPAESVRAGLSQIGFHWNNYRKCWQHPCGTLNSQLSTHHSEADPRQKYGSHFAADVQAI